MKKNNLTFFFQLLIILSLSGCIPTPPGTSTETVTSSIKPTNTSQPIEHGEITPTGILKPTMTPTPWPPSAGPWLLIQSGFTDYQILDLHLRTAYPFDPPGEHIQPNLAAQISPSGQQMIFHLKDATFVVMDLITGEVQTINDPLKESSYFQPDLAVLEAREVFPEEAYSPEALLSAVTTAYLQSKSNLRWYKNDRYRLSVLDTNQTSTSLHLDEHQTGQRHQLEDMPGLVENYWIGPTGEMILLKKGYSFEPGDWEDDSYYIVETDTPTAHPIPLPEEVDNPSVFWLTETSIGIIHQTRFVGGVDFSTYNLLTQETNLLIAGAFSSVRPFDGNLLVIRTDQDADLSMVEILTLEGETIQTQTIQETCFFSRLLSSQIILNCTMQSLIMDGSLQVTPFGEPVYLLAPAPNSKIIVLVDRMENVYLLDRNFQDRQPLSLNAAPLEIRWLPDSSGFLYRASGKLYLYQLASATSHHLLTSDIFDDYANMNAVWINLE
jgi:hypothetical protein